MVNNNSTTQNKNNASNFAWKSNRQLFQALKINHWHNSFQNVQMTCTLFGKNCQNLFWIWIFFTNFERKPRVFVWREKKREWSLEFGTMESFVWSIFVSFHFHITLELSNFSAMSIIIFYLLLFRRRKRIHRVNMHLVSFLRSFTLMLVWVQ